MTTFTYDALNRLQNKSYSGGGVNYMYDGGSLGIGRLSYIASGYPTGNVQTSNLAFDPMGRVLSSTTYNSAAGDPQRFNFTYTYNLAGSLTSETYPSGRRITINHDGANRESSVGGQFGWQPPQTLYASNVMYAPQGAASSYVYPSGINVSTVFNSRLQPCSLEHFFPPGDQPQTPLEEDLFWGTNEPHCGITGDNNGTVRAIENWNGATAAHPRFITFLQDFSYDNANRLIYAQERNVTTDPGPFPVDWSRNFNYDLFGNMWVPSATGITPAGNTPSSAGSFDTQTNRLSDSSYDAAGNQLVVNGNQVTYDGDNRPINISAGSSVIASYGYDGDGNRVVRTTPNGTTVYIYDAFDQLAAEYSSNTTTASPCQTCYLHRDHLGNVRLITDTAGNIIARHDFLPFGEEIPSGVPAGTTGRDTTWNAADNINQRFTGKERDQESGLDYFGARYYGSALGRFTSPDPDNTGAWLSDPQGWNMYAYGRNNPLKYVDPLGESYQICDANGKNCAKDELSDKDFDKEKQAAQGNGEHFNNGVAYHYDDNGNRVNDATYRQTDVDIDPSLAQGLHNAGVQSTAALNSFMKDAAMNAAGGFVLAGVGPAISEFLPAAENLPLLRQVSRVLSNNSLKHIVNRHLAEFQALDAGLTLNRVVDIGIDVAETGTQIGTKTFVKTVTIGGQQVEVKAVLNSNNGLRSVFPNQ